MGGKPGDNGDSGTVKLRLNEEREEAAWGKGEWKGSGRGDVRNEGGGSRLVCHAEEKEGGWQHRAWGRGARLAPRLGHGRHGRHTTRVGEGAKGLTCGAAQDLNQNQPSHAPKN
jgi:hypothetical protein